MLWFYVLMLTLCCVFYVFFMYWTLPAICLQASFPQQGSQETRDSKPAESALHLQVAIFKLQGLASAWGATAQWAPDSHTVTLVSDSLCQTHSLWPLQPLSRLPHDGPVFAPKSVTCGCGSRSSQIVCVTQVLCVVVPFSAVRGPRWRYITANVSQAWASMTLVDCLSPGAACDSAEPHHSKVQGSMVLFPDGGAD
jgi:hypothetical protein